MKGRNITPMIIEASCDIGALMVCVFLFMAVIAFFMAIVESYDKVSTRRAIECTQEVSDDDL